MKSERRKESVIHDKADLPAGYVAMGTLASGSGSTPLYTYMQRAWERGEWGRSLFKCRGKRFIHKDDLDRLTAEFNAKQASEPSVSGEHKGDESFYGSKAGSLASIAFDLGRIEIVLERLALAVESIATQPRQTDGDFKALAEDQFNDFKREIINGTHYS